VSDDAGAIDGRFVDFSDADPNAPDAGPSQGCVPGGAQCNNCLDDDNDGRIDGADPECTGAADNDESSFATGISGDNRDDRRQDCFFDGNSGEGDDKCSIHTCCLLDVCPSTLQPTYNPAECTPSQDCINNCEPLTPPGCDCFGCCTVCDDLGCVDIYTNPAVAPDCDELSIRDPAKCPTCTQSSQCGTPCTGECVLCPGQDPSDLPMTCTNPTCPDGLSSCMTTSDCNADEYCAAGCCIRAIE
jgi:hypothetical protein